MKKKPKKIKHSELWNLDYTLAEYILPRLVAFRKMKRTGTPASLGTKKEWDIMLDDMIYAMKYVLKDGMRSDERAQRGLEEFGKHFLGLWD
mgnify:CR=1 FL=1